MRSVDVARPDTWGAAIAAGAQAVAAGRIVVLPTDTVYGVGASPTDAQAVRRVLELKGRDGSSPSPVLVGRPGDMEALGVTPSPAATRLMDHMWPGALTLIVPTASAVARNLGAKADTIAVRMPDHPFALALLSELGPLAVTSANHTGEPPATTCSQAYQALGEAVDVYFDAGPTPGPVASTIVDLTGAEPVIVRPGVLEARRVLELARGAGPRGSA